MQVVRGGGVVVRVKNEGSAGRGVGEGNEGSVGSEGSEGNVGWMVVHVGRVVSGRVCDQTNREGKQTKDTGMVIGLR